jgi:UDP-N-acetylglucosamine 2-epimerase (non-hydrolysing)
MKLAIVVGTRPEIIRLSAVINRARQIFEVVLIHTGQNYDYNLNEIFFRDLSIGKPEVYLDCSRESLGHTVGDIIAKTYEIFRRIKPDALLIDGDTNSCLSAYSAKRLKIPIFHFEAGHRCFDLNLPEEINRKLVDHLSDVNICYTEHARRNLLQENCPTEYTFVVGSPMREVLAGIRDKIASSTALERYGLQRGGYFVWSSHREENVTQRANFLLMVDSLKGLVVEYDLPVFFPAHPRTRAMIEEQGVELPERVILSEPIGIIDYCCLQTNAKCVISDSGTLTEETDILGFKGIMLRTSTEKPEGIDAGTVTIGNLKWETLRRVVKLVLSQDANGHDRIGDYLPEDVSDKVCKIVIGYTDIVNKFIWRKSSED